MSEFRDTPTSLSQYRTSTFDPSPPVVGQRGPHTASIVSGPGMAGHGATYAAAQYNYGQDDSEIAQGGPYSSEPQPQHAYNAEAYGSYAYSTDGAQAVQHPYNQYPDYSRYADNEDAHSPALVAGAPAVPAGRGARQSAAINDADVYGGI